MKKFNTDPTKANYEVLFELLVSSRFRILCMLDSNRLQDKSRYLLTFFTKTLNLRTYFIEHCCFSKEKMLTLVYLCCNLTIL